MSYIISLAAINFSRQIDEVTAIHLASVSGLFATFKYQIEIYRSRQTIPVFHVDQPFSWQTLDLFLVLFSGFGRSLLWEVDNVVEFVQICSYFMVNERFLNDLFRATFPRDYCHLFRENHFCAVLFTLRSSGYLCLARNLMHFASREFEGIFVFEDLMAALSAFNFQRVVEQRYSELEDS